MRPSSSPNQKCRLSRTLALLLRYGNRGRDHPTAMLFAWFSPFLGSQIYPKMKRRNNAYHKASTIQERSMLNPTAAMCFQRYASSSRLCRYLADQLLTPALRCANNLLPRPAANPTSAALREMAGGAGQLPPREFYEAVKAASKAAAGLEEHHREIVAKGMEDTPTLRTIASETKKSLLHRVDAWTVRVLEDAMRLPILYARRSRCLSGLARATTAPRRRAPRSRPPGPSRRCLLRAGGATQRLRRVPQGGGPRS